MTPPLVSPGAGSIGPTLPSNRADFRSPQKGTSIRVGIVDDHAVVREAIRRLLLDHGDFLVVGETGEGCEALRLVDSVTMDVLILDLAMRGRSGYDLLSSIRSRAPALHLLVFSGLTESSYARRALKEGAHGFVHKASDPSELIFALRRVAAGNRHLSAALARQLAVEVAERQVQAHERLSKREFQVLIELTIGKKAAAVGRQLNLSAKTVTLYRARLLRKLGLTTNTELTLFAISQGLLT
jgi:DNA-binding NarL/FixJ family response regulator